MPRLGLFDVGYVAAATAVSGGALPTSDPDLWGWWSADYGITKDGSDNMFTADDWLDRNGVRNLSSGVANYTRWKGSPTTAMPTGNPAVRFDPSLSGSPSPRQSTSGSGGLNNLANIHTVYLLLWTASWIFPKYFMDGNSSNSGALSMQPNVSGTVAQINPNYGAQITSMPTSTWFILTSVFNNASSTLQVNSLTPATGNPGTNVPARAVFGGWAGGGVYDGTFELGAMIISNAANNAEIQAIHKGWLAAYHGGITV